MSNRIASIFEAIGNAFTGANTYPAAETPEQEMSPLPPAPTFQEPFDIRAMGINPMSLQSVPAAQAEEILTKGSEAFGAMQGIKDNPAAVKDPTFRQRLTEMFGDEKRMLGLALAFNTLRFEPDQTLAAVIGKRLDTIDALAAEKEAEQAELQQVQSQLNRTAQYFRDQGRPDLADAVANGTMKPKDAYAVMKDPAGVAANKWYLENPEKAAELVKMGVVGPNVTKIDLPGKQEEAIMKMQAEAFGEMSAGGAQARELATKLALLEQVGAYEDFNKVPGWIRARLPEGINSSVDAYNAILPGVAQALRVPGSGAMSDRDVDLLMAQAGAVGTSLEARRVVQQALMEAAETRMEYANIANMAQRGSITFEEANRRIDALNKRGLLSEEMRKRLRELQGQPQKVGTTPDGLSVKEY